MLFSIIQKYLSPDFLNGTFFYFTFLTDSRFSIFELFFPFAIKESVYKNIDQLELLQANVQTVKLFTPSIWLYTISKIISWYTFFIELALAIVYLVPNHWKLAKLRNILLLIFVITVYPLVPIPGFASLILILGYTSSSNQSSQRLYHALFFIFMIYIYVFGLWMKSFLLNL